MYDLMKEETDTPIYFILHGSPDPIRAPTFAQYSPPTLLRLGLGSLKIALILLKAATISRKVGGMAVGFRILNQQFRACKSATKCLRPMSL